LISTWPQQVRGHVFTQIGLVVVRRDREVAALDPGLVTLVATFFRTAGIPPALLGIDLVEGTVHRGVESNVVEDVELGLGAEKAGVSDTGAGQVLLGLAGNIARVARIGLQGERVVHEEVARHRLSTAERIDPGGAHVGQQRHVGLVDRLETLDGRSVEGHAAGQRFRRDGRSRHGEVVHQAGEVAEPDVEDLDVVVLDVSDQFFGGGEHSRTPSRRKLHRTGRERNCTP